MLTQEEIRSAIGGKFFRVRFTKRTNGEERVMRCRLGVRKYLSGKGSKYSFESKGLLSVYDMANHGYRAIPLDAVTELRCGTVHLQKDGTLSKRVAAHEPTPRPVPSARQNVVHFNGP